MIEVTNDYDLAIQGAVRAWLPSWYDWRLYKAQLLKESSLDPNAVSPVGAEGLAQFMPPTWGEVAGELKYPDGASPFDPDYAIPAGAYYLNKMRAKWFWDRPEADRIALSLACYNAGTGNLLQAQRIADMATDYAAIISKLHLVTGDRSKETRNYVRKIHQYFGAFVVGTMG